MVLKQNLADYIHTDMLNINNYSGQSYIVSGCEVKENSPTDMNVIVSSGEYVLNGVKVVCVGDTILLTAANPLRYKYAIIRGNSSGVLSVVYGQEEATNGIKPNRPLNVPNYEPDDYVALARIRVGDVSEIINNDIIDLRQFNSIFNIIDENKFDTIEMNIKESTDSNATLTDADASLWDITNVGADNIYLNFGSSATTDNFYLKPNENIIINLNQVQLNYICRSGETSDLSVVSGKATNNKFSNFISKNVSISNSSTAIYNDTNSYKEWLIFNDGVEDVYLNFGSSAATSNFKLKSGKYTVIVFESNKLYGITESGTAVVRILGLRM